MFQPYREAHVLCSRKCRESLPDAKQRSKAYSDRLDVRERKNAARRIAVNPARRQMNFRQNLQRHGLTVEQYEAMLAAQDGACVICGDPPDPNGIKAASRLHVDHDHTTGRNRDLLCCRCNQGIGYFKDDPVLFRAAAAYIERHRASSA
jgi:hypothetical protein